VTTDIEDASINHLFIRDPPLINALGLVAPDYDTIHLSMSKLKLDEVLTIRTFPSQRPQRLDEWIIGELMSARQAYLYWLDKRKSADPRGTPYAAEARVIARKTGRRCMDVRKEIERPWDLEQRSSGGEYRGNWLRYLGEDPAYLVGADEGSVMRSMFQWVRGVRDTGLL
jgi:hypothetical protein